MAIRIGIGRIFKLMWDAVRVFVAWLLIKLGFTRAPDLRSA